MNRNRGATLIEVVVYSGVLLLLLGAVYSFLNLGLAYVRQGEAFQTAHQQAQIALAKFTLEVENCRPECILAGDAPTNFLIFVSPDPQRPNPRSEWTISPRNRIDWQKWVCLYLDQASSEFRRIEFSQPPLPTDNPPTPSDSRFPAWDDFEGRDFEVLARNIEELSFAVEPSIGGQPTVTMTVLARVTVNSDKNAEVEIQGRVSPRNSRSF